MEKPAEAIVDQATLDTLRSWREVLRRLQLLGQDPARYGGLGFGNVSARDPSRPDEFVITASQTAGAPQLSERQLVRITHSNVERFWVDAQGYQPPSSESLTHAMIYRADAKIGWVFHVHSPEIWQRAEALALPTTGADVRYGSAAMATAVAALLAAHSDRRAVFATLGHDDGVFACGASAEAAGSALVDVLARSLA